MHAKERPGMRRGSEAATMTMKRGDGCGWYSRSGRGAPSMHAYEGRRDGTGSPQRMKKKGTTKYLKLAPPSVSHSVNDPMKKKLNERTNEQEKAGAGRSCERGPTSGSSGVGYRMSQ